MTNPSVSRWHHELERWLEPGCGVEPPQSFGLDSMGERQGDLIDEKLENLEREHAGVRDLLPGRESCSLGGWHMPSGSPGSAV